MNAVVLFLLLLAAVSGESVPVANGTEFLIPSAYDYHRRVGIPHAAEIKKHEDEIMMTRNLDHRIVGGAVSALNAHPYMAGLVVTFTNALGSSACGSTLLTANRLVTAAHCWFDGVNQARQFEVVFASQYLFYGGTRIATQQVITHPSYNALVSNIVNDIAMIYLPTAVFLSTSIQPVSLPSTTELSNLFVGSLATAVGYGKQSDLEVGVTLNTMMREVNLQVISLANCQAAFGASARAENLCTSGVGNIGICGGDSGGPLTTILNGQRVLIGVSSFVAFNACHLGFPSVFARVTSFYSFIVQHLV